MTYDSWKSEDPAEDLSRDDDDRRSMHEIALTCDSCGAPLGIIYIDSDSDPIGNVLCQACERAGL